MITLVVNSNDDISKSINRSKLVRQQKQIIRNGKPVMTYVWVNPDKNKNKTKHKNTIDEELDRKYMDAIKKGDIETVRKMVYDKAEKMVLRMLFQNRQKDIN